MLFFLYKFFLYKNIHQVVLPQLDVYFYNKLRDCYVLGFLFSVLSFPTRLRSRGHNFNNPFHSCKVLSSNNFNIFFLMSKVNELFAGNSCFFLRFQGSSHSNYTYRPIRIITPFCYTYFTSIFYGCNMYVLVIKHN